MIGLMYGIHWNHVTIFYMVFLSTFQNFSHYLSSSHSQIHESSSQLNDLRISSALEKYIKIFHHGFTFFRGGLFNDNSIPDLLRFASLYDYKKLNKKKKETQKITNGFFNMNVLFPGLIQVMWTLTLYQVSLIFFLTGSLDRVFANGLGDQVQSHVESYQRLKKMVLDISLLNTQHCKVWIKDKVEQSKERSSTLSYTSV